MIHIFVWRGFWYLDESIQREAGLIKVAFLKKLGLEVEYVGF